MRFRDKVLASNIILLSIALGILGYIMIRQNFSLALESLKEQALLQNNLVQSNVEYELLDIMNSDVSVAQISSAIPEIGTRVHSGMMTMDETIFIYFNEQLLFQGGNDTPPDDTLFDKLTLGTKHVLLEKEKDSYQMYVTSKNVIHDTNLYVVTKTEVTSAYTLMHRQIRFFKMTLFFVLVLCSLLMFLISRMLTRPLEQLHLVANQLSDGDYQARAEVKTQDEIGELAKSFNLMACSIKEHIDALTAMIKQKEQFVADFTHEMKTPMTSIIGYADMLRSKELTKERQVLAANYIFSEGKRLEIMSRKLFDLIYLSQNEIPLKKLSVTRLFEEVTQSVSPMLTAKGLTLSTTLSPFYISGDIELLKTVFINLIDNARKASKKDDIIIITGQATDDCRYQICVTDNGIGMTQEDVKRVCDEFYMVDKSRTRREGGAGLGLSLVSIILERHHAEWSLESTLNQGTTVIITLLPWKEEQQ